MVSCGREVGSWWTCAGRQEDERKSEAAGRGTKRQLGRQLAGCIPRIPPCTLSCTMPARVPLLHGASPVNTTTPMTHSVLRMVQPRRSRLSALRGSRPRNPTCNSSSPTINSSTSSSHHGVTPVVAVLPIPQAACTACAAFWPCKCTANAACSSQTYTQTPSLSPPAHTQGHSLKGTVQVPTLPPRPPTPLTYTAPPPHPPAHTPSPHLLIEGGCVGADGAVRPHPRPLPRPARRRPRHGPPPRPRAYAQPQGGRDVPAGDGALKGIQARIGRLRLHREIPRAAEVLCVCVGGGGGQPACAGGHVMMRQLQTFLARLKSSAGWTVSAIVTFGATRGWLQWRGRPSVGWGH